MFEKILVLLDGSKLSELSLPSVEELAAAFNSRVDLVCVCEPAEREYRHMAQLYIERIAGQVSGHASLHSVTPLLLSGKPASEIIEYAEKSDANLIVLTSHGRSGTKPWTLGSTAVKVIERVTRPVLLVRADFAGTKESIFSNILVPLDGSANSEAVIPYVKQLTLKWKSEVILLRAVVSGYHMHTIGGLDYLSLPEAQIEKMKAEAGPYLAKIGDELRGTLAEVSNEIRTGDAAEEIMKAADEKGTRLIAMSAHGHSGIERWTFGSVTDRVMHSARTSLLLVRAG